MTRNELQDDLTQFLTQFCEDNGASQEFLKRCLRDLNRHLDIVFKPKPVKVKSLRKPR